MYTYLYIYIYIHTYYTYTHITDSPDMRAHAHVHVTCVMHYADPIQYNHHTNTCNNCTTIRYDTMRYAII